MDFIRLAPFFYLPPLPVFWYYLHQKESIEKPMPINRDHIYLLKNLVAKDLKVRYKASALGFFWSLLRPLFLIVILSVVFSRLFRDMAFYLEVPYSLFLICGILPWAFFADGLHGSVRSLVDNSPLIKKVKVPREIFPLTAVVSNLINFTLAMLVFLPVMYLVYGVPFTWQILLLPLVILLQLAFMIALALLASLLNVFFRDTEVILDVVIMGWFYATPVLYDFNFVKPGLSQPAYYLFLANPMAIIIYWYRRTLLAGVQLKEGMELPLSTNENLAMGAILLVVTVVLFLLARLMAKKYGPIVADRL